MPYPNKSIRPPPDNNKEKSKGIRHSNVYQKQELKRNSLNMKSSDRVFICGKTGSGKSTLTEYLLSTAEHLIVIDGKDSDDIRDNWNVVAYNREKHLQAIKEHKPMRIRLVNNMEEIIEVLNVAYTYGNITLYIDEITATIPPRTKPPAIFTDIWTRGRSRNIGAWSGTQRPSQIPLEFISESEHLFIFKLTLENDRKRMAGMAGKKVLSPPLDQHGFYYYNVNDGKLYYFNRLAI